MHVEFNTFYKGNTLCNQHLDRSVPSSNRNQMQTKKCLEIKCFHHLTLSATSVSIHERDMDFIQHFNTINFTDSRKENTITD